MTRRFASQIVSGRVQRDNLSLASKIAAGNLDGNNCMRAVVSSIISMLDKVIVLYRLSMFEPVSLEGLASDWPKSVCSPLFGHVRRGTLQLQIQ